MSHNKRNTSKQLFKFPRPRSSMLACDWRSRCCVIYVFRQTPPCVRFMQRNIEHKGEGDYNNHSACDLRTCTDVANFIPSTVSVNWVKDPWHIHWTDKRAYAQHSAMRRHTKLQESNWKTLKTRLIPLIVAHLHKSWYKNQTNSTNPHFCFDLNIKNISLYSHQDKNENSWD